LTARSQLRFGIETVSVCAPGASVLGTCTVALIVPVASAVTVPRTAGALCRVIVAVPPGSKPVLTIVRSAPGRRPPPRTVVAQGACGGYGSSAAAVGAA